MASLHLYEPKVSYAAVSFILVFNTFSVSASSVLDGRSRNCALMRKN